MIELLDSVFYSLSIGCCLCAILQWFIFQDEEKKQFIVALNLDETLISITTCRPLNWSKNVFAMTIEGQKYYVYERPYLRDFLTSAHNMFDVYLFTSDDETYAAPIVNEIIRRYNVPTFDRCFYRVIDFDFIDVNEHMIVVDHASCKYPQNTLHVSPFSSNDWQKDDDLLRMIPLLQHIYNHGGDVRKTIQRYRIKNKNV